MPNDALHSLCEAVDQAALMSHMNEFARRIKLSGTPEELESFRYLRARLDEYGFQTNLLSHDAYISLPGRARVVAGDRELAGITHSFSRPSPPGGATAELVHVGTGEAADFAGRDLTGKIVLVDGMARPEVSLRASLAGCLGQLHISPNEIPHEMCISPVWGSPTQESASLLPSTVVCSVSRSDGIALRARLAVGEGLEASLHAEVDTGWRQTPILIAEMAGFGPDGEEPFVMFSGHHDTWYYGVMDNGGANATMLEVARLLAPRRAEWRRGLRLAFWSGHSHGRYSGSTWYADEYWDELARRCVVHVNVDSTGARGNTILSDAPAAAELRGLAREAIAAQSGQSFSGKRMVRAGDQSFWGVGVPSMFMSVGKQEEGGGLGWWWHTPEDKLGKIVPELLVRDTRLFAHTLWRLLTDEVVPLDYAEHARDLLDFLRGIAQRLTGEFDLGALIARAEMLARKAAALNERAAMATGAEAASVNRALIAVSRALVPMDYTTGDRFAHDPALPQAIYPALQPLKRLASLPRGSDEAGFLRVGMTRARNRVAAALDAANAAINACLSGADRAPGSADPRPGSPRAR